MRDWVKSQVWIERNPIGPWLAGPRTMRADVASRTELTNLGHLLLAESAEPAALAEFGDDLAVTDRIATTTAPARHDDLAFVDLELDVF